MHENRLRVKGRYGDYSSSTTSTGSSMGTGISGTPGTTTSFAAAGGGKSTSNT